jgi:DNA-binding NarL/FixJ family response regulator
MKSLNSQQDQGFHRDRGPTIWDHASMPLRVLVVDDHAGFRRFARRLLAATGVEVIGEAVDGRSALEGFARLRPDVVVLDVLLPDISGIDVARRLAVAKDPPIVVLTSSRTAEDFGAQLDDVPAAAFIAKEELSGTTLRAAIEPAAP